MCKVKTLFTLRSTMTPNKERVACSPNASPVQIVLSAKIIANDKKAKEKAKTLHVIGSNVHL